MHAESTLEKLGPGEECDDAFHDCFELLTDAETAQKQLYRRTLERSRSRVASHMRADR